MIEITTKRLIIRDHIKSDLLDIHALLSDDECMYYLPDIKTNNIKESEDNLKIAIEECILENRCKYFFGIINKESDDYIGEIGFTKLIESKQGNVFGLGYFIKKQYWGRKIATEAARAIIDYAFKYLDTIKIESGCLAQNKASENIMKKLGMTKEAELKSHVLFDTKLCDRVEYGIMKHEWNELN